MCGQATRSCPRLATYDAVTVESSPGINCWMEIFHWWIFIGLMFYKAGLPDGATKGLRAAGKDASQRWLEPLATATSCAARQAARRTPALRSFALLLCAHS